jgi:hypothetical protein
MAQNDKDLTYFARPGQIGWSRQEVLIRDRYRCAY